MSVSFAPSTQFQQWMTKLRVSWMGRKAQAIMGAFAKVAGDLTYDWMLQANFEHLPEYAASSTSVGLIASERQLDQGPTETTAQLATRTTQATLLWRYAGSPLGVLLALHYAGFDNAVLVQQNGLSFQLQLPLPSIPVISGQTWRPETSLVVGNCSSLATALHSSVDLSRSIPAGTPWWMFDSDTDFCSRFAVLFPGPALPPWFYTTGRATFSGTDAATLTWSNAFPTATYNMLPGPAVVTDGGGSIVVFVDGSTATTTGVTVRASAPFTGYADVLAWQLGAASPFADPHPNDLTRLQNAISKWRPKKATCVGVFVLLQGKFLGWPVRTLGSGTLGPSTVSQVVGSF